MREYLKLQEEVMDFELKHMEMIQAETTAARNSDNTRAIGSSQVLEELNQQVEELQNKLKVSYRKLLLYETENQKLIQEKNAFFFENKVYAEHNALLVEKNRTLQTTHDDMVATIEKKTHKIEIAEKLIEAQKTDLTRLSKFHEKVKNIIKPFIQNLKDQNAVLTADVEIKTRTIAHLEAYQAELTVRVNALQAQAESDRTTYGREKSALIQSYEEQIHFLSKEIVEQQQRTHDANNENLRLKKQCETKHFVENELVKYKRLQDDNIQTVNSLRLKESELQRQLTEIQVAESNAKNQITGLAAELESNKELLDATRRQLSLKITEVEDLTLRLKMLEKLNSNLSLNLKDYQT
jgi:chromosome segregation ATPase